MFLYSTIDYYILVYICENFFAEINQSNWLDDSSATENSVS